jgi:hypothetical protein
VAADNSGAIKRQLWSGLKDMAVPNIRLSTSMMDDIMLICDLGPDVLSRVVNVLQTRSVTIRSAALRQVIAAEIGDETAEVIERLFVLAVATTRRRGTITSSILLDGVHKSLVSKFGAETVQLKKWNESRPFIEKIFEINSVKLSAKATELSYDFEKLFIAGRILTDIRPIFDDSNSQILGTAITQTLRLEYTSADGDQSSISIAMDINDIKRLENVCKEALCKADVSRKLVEQKCGLETLMAGEDVK